MSVKKQVTLYLDGNVYEKAKKHFDSQGQSVSGYVNVVLDEYMKTVEGQPEINIDKMTLPQFLKTAQYWVDQIRKQEKSNG